MPENITLSLYHSVNRDYSITKTLLKLARTFGIPRCSYDRYLKSWNWGLKPNPIQKSINIIEDFKTSPNNATGPITLGIIWFFKIKDTQTGKMLEHQGMIPTIVFRLHNSQLYLRQGKESAISAWFTLPFQQFGNCQQKYLDQLTNTLPFKPLDKHWRMWSKSKNKN